MDLENDIQNKSQEQNHPEENKTNFQEGQVIENQNQIFQSNTDNQIELEEFVSACRNREYEFSEFERLIEAINSNNRFLQYYGIIGLRKLVSSDSDPPIQPIVDTNLVLRLIELLKEENEPNLQVEAAWALSNITTGPDQHAKTVVDCGGIPCFVELLKSNNIYIVEQAIWGLGNLSGDSTIFRDLIMDLGALDILLKLLDANKKSAIYQSGFWALSNLCKSKPLPRLEMVQDAIPIICKLFKQENNLEILGLAASALAELSESPIVANEILKTGILTSLTVHLKAKGSMLEFFCIKMIQNFLLGSEEQIDIVLQTPDLVPKMFRCLKNTRIGFRSEVCRAISSIAAGKPSQIERIIEDPYYIDMLIKTSISDATEVQKEAVCVLRNAVSACNLDQAVKMVESGVLDCLLYLLIAHNPKIIIVALEGIESILNKGQRAVSENQFAENWFLKIVLEKGAEQLENLVVHPDSEVYSKTSEILENYFSEEFI